MTNKNRIQYFSHVWLFEIKPDANKLPSVVRQRFALALRIGDKIILHNYKEPEPRFVRINKTKSVKMGFRISEKAFKHHLSELYDTCPPPYPRFLMPTVYRQPEINNSKSAI